MIARGLDVVLDAQRGRAAIGAFTTYTSESTRAICEAAVRTGRPVIIQAGSGAFRVVGRSALAAAALAAAEEATVPVGVHLDHSTDLGEIRACLALGYSSVMIDGSHEDFETNVALTTSVVNDAHAVGAWVEAELGALSGDEDTSVDRGGGVHTDPARVEEFVARTGVDVLAVAIGSVHGIPTAPVHLDLELLAAIRERTEVPLALHGASGLDPAELAGAIGLGICKVNINAELRQAYLGALRSVLERDGDDVVAVQRAAVDAITTVVEEKIAFLAQLGRDRSDENGRG